MKSKFDRYMKHTVRFIALLMLYYLFLYAIVRISLSIIVKSYDLSIGYDIGCHVFAFVFLIITFIRHENNDDSNANPA